MISFDTTTASPDMRRDMVRAVIQQMRTDTGGPRAEPPYHPLLVKPAVHHVVAWRHDGEVRKTAYDTRELAFSAARALHWAVVWKYAVMDGRDMIARALVNPPAD